MRSTETRTRGSNLVSNRSIRALFTLGRLLASKIEEAIPERERESLSCALRSRPAGSDPLSVLDYLHLKQLPVLLFANDVQQETRSRLDAPDAKRKLNDAVDLIAPVRNEIAHVREVSPQRLQETSVACDDMLALFKR